MKELSLNVLDIAQNSVTAGADRIDISLTEDEEGILKLSVTDNGCGMDEETLRRVSDPFYTTRTTRRVGMGVPLLKLAAEQTGGSLAMQSRTAAVFSENHGTELVATFNIRHIDFTPVGDMVSTVTALVGGHPEIRFVFLHKTPQFEVNLDTAELQAVLGDVPLSSPEVLLWLSDYLKQQYETE